MKDGKFSAIEAVAHHINEDINTITQALATGNVESFDQFRYLRGQLWGLMVALDYAKTYQKREEEL